MKNANTIWLQQAQEWSRSMNGPISAASGRNNDTIFANEAEADEHRAFVAWLRENHIRYWEMTSDQFDRVKAEFKRTRK